MPPVEFWRGVSPRKAENSRPEAKALDVLDRGQDRRGGDRADAGNGHQPPGRLVGLDRRGELLVDRSDRLVERVDLADERRERVAHALGDHDLAVVVDPVDQPGASGRRRVCAPCGATTPISARWPRNALSAAVRWPDRSSRVRWRISSAWLSTERTGTNRWPGRPAASQIAAASAASFLLRRT